MVVRIPGPTAARWALSRKVKRDWECKFAPRVCVLILRGLRGSPNSARDRELLSEINDYLVVTRCYLHPQALIYFPLFAATGSVVGSLLLYTLLRRGGQAVLHQRFRIEHIQRVEGAYARFGFFALAVPALWPP